MTTNPSIETLLYQWRDMADRARQPFVWAHIVQACLVSAVSQSSDRDPILRVLIGDVDAIIHQVGRAPGETGLDAGGILLLANGLTGYQRAHPPARAIALHDQILRWLASNLAEPADWTLLRIIPLFKKFGLGPGHFDGREPWPAEAPMLQSDTTTVSWEEQLAQLVGLGAIKEEVIRLRSFLMVLKQRKVRGKPTAPLPLHQVFLGNPGTGKTTIARVLAGIYKEFGFLERGHLVETDRSGLVGSVIGETELKTREKIHAALGGVLFIDEAYSLATQSQQDFGQRAIDTLVKAMEDYRDRFVVIVAGYASEMQRFLESNPGLYGRFNRHFVFPDYTGDELLEIYQQLARREAFTVQPEGVERILRALAGRRERLGQLFANARDVRSLWELTLQHQAARHCTGCRSTAETEAALSRLEPDVLFRITPEDIPTQF